MKKAALMTDFFRDIDAETVLYLANAHYTTGQVLGVDGGFII